ncbi:hypothetical protein [Rhizobacter fulvus]|jgi:hypothetical protein
MRFAIPALTLAAALALAAGPAAAKLPPPSDEAKAKAAETAAKNAWTDKVGAFKLCQVMNRTVDHYRKSPEGRDAPPPIDTPPCTDPGAFVPPAPPASAPLEAAGAHSPPGMATSPPSSKETAAEKQGQPKK